MGNPTDTGVASLLDPSLYEKAIEIVAEDEGIDMILVISTPVPECLELRGRAAAIDKPLAVSVYALAGVGAGDLRDAAAKGVAAYPDPKRAAYVLARMAEYAAFVEAGREPTWERWRLPRTLDAPAHARYME